MKIQLCLKSIKTLKRSQLIEIFIALVVLELFVFSDVLMPIQWGRIIISGQLHSGPNAKLISGKCYLRWSMPDSLNARNIDLSQIQLMAVPNSASDPMGVDEYIVRGKIRGIFKESSNSPTYLMFEVVSYSYINPILKYSVLILFYIQLLLFIIILQNKPSKINQAKRTENTAQKPS
ncbi:MAG TPA: hypothetical protein VGF79_15625 [Bacteroidia bacterium]